MDIWKILGVEKCKDKNLIINAYREKLMVTNPEDYPEEFKELRNAYDEALKYADTSEDLEEQEDNSPEGLFIKRVAKLYHNFYDRINVEKWKELLSEDICIAIDTKVEIRNRILQYCMQAYRLPQNVWILLDDTFQVQENIEELYELFPREFIDNAVISGIQYGISIRMDFFDGEGTADYDSFIMSYFKLMDLIDERKIEDAKNLINEMKETDIYHPYMDIAQIRIHLVDVEYDKAKLLSEELCGKFPDDYFINLYKGETAYYTEDIETAHKIFDEVLAEKPKIFLARFGKAMCLNKTGDLQHAKNLLWEMLGEYNGNLIVKNAFDDVNNQMLEKYMTKVAENADDAESAIELGWCYLHAYKITEGIEIVKKYKPVHKDRFSYLNLSTQLYLENKNYENALGNAVKWAEISRDLEDDGSEEVQKELKRKELPINLQATALKELNRNKEALECLDKSLSINPESKDALFQKALLLYSDKQYNECVHICGEINKLSSSFWQSLLLHAKCLYELNSKQAAFDCLNNVFNIYPYSLDAYIYKIKILADYGEYDSAINNIEYLENEKVESDKLNMCKIRVKMQNKTMKEADAITAYEVLIKKYEAGNSDIERGDELYYYYALLLEQKRNFNTIIKILDKGLELDLTNIHIIEYKAYIYQENRQLENARNCYKAVLDIDAESLSAIKGMGNTLFEESKYKEAIIWYEKFNSKSQIPYIYNMLGRCYIELVMYEEAKSNLAQSIEIEPNETSNHYYMAYALMCNGELDSALIHAKTAVELMINENRKYRNGYRLISQIYSRQEKYDEAINTIIKNVELFDNGELMELTHMYSRKGDYKLALETLEKWKDFTKNTSSLDVYMLESACIYFSMEDWNKGYNRLKKVKENIGNKNHTIWYYYVMTKKYSNAIKIGKELVKERPNDYQGYMWIAEAAFRSKNKKLSVKNAEKVLELLEVCIDNDIQNKQIYLCDKAICMLILGRHEEALKLIEQAQNEPLASWWYTSGNCVVLEVMAFYYEVIGENQKALLELDKLVNMDKNNALLSLNREGLKRRLKNTWW
jgi:hypothetical protein